MLTSRRRMRVPHFRSPDSPSQGGRFARRARRLLRVLAIGLLLAPAGGCVWLQNEFFVYDVAPPTPEPEAAPAAHAPW